MKSDGLNKTGIGFKDGVCDACRFNKEKQLEIDWSQRSEKFYSLLSKYRKNNEFYDVLVPSSGGKDSSYTAYLLKHKYRYESPCNNLGAKYVYRYWTE